jgi:hypothetical protein
MNDSTPVNGHTLRRVLGMDLPEIADLGDGWFLLAHPNGVAIATEHSLAALFTESKETKQPPEFDALDEDMEDGLLPPEAIRAKAVEVFVDLAWPFVRYQFWQDTGQDQGGVRRDLGQGPKPGEE